MSSPCSEKQNHQIYWISMHGVGLILNQFYITSLFCLSWMYVTVILVTDMPGMHSCMVLICCSFLDDFR